MTDVYIKVLDENDNAPIFDRNRYVAVLVPSEAHIGHVVTNVMLLIFRNPRLIDKRL